MRALLVEDDKLTARSIELALSAEGIICDTLDISRNMATDAVAVGQLNDYDIMIFDIKLGEDENNMDGFDAILQLRAAKIKAPILVLSGMSSVQQKVKGLGFGADDYMTKPFNRSELIARLQAIVRRSRGHPAAVINIGKISINLDNRTVEVAGKPLHLTSKEYAILELLSLRVGTILTKEVFLNHLYGGVDEPELKIIDVFVCKLRKKIYQACGDNNYIETVWGRGYVLKDRKAEAPKKEDASSDESSSDNNEEDAEQKKEGIT